MTHPTPAIGEKLYFTYEQNPDGDKSKPAYQSGEVADTDGPLVFEVRTGMLTYTIDLEAETIGYESRDGLKTFPLLDAHEERVEDVLIDSDDLPDYVDRYTDDLEDVSGAIDRANAVIGMVYAQSDAEFIKANTALEAANIYENGLDQYIEEFNETTYGISESNRATIQFPSGALAYIWMEEICGQISDGAWENKVGNWQKYYGAKVEVDTSLENVEVYGDLRSLNFKEELFKYEGLVGRMMFYAVASGLENMVTPGDIEDMVTLKLQNGFAQAYTA